MAEFVNKDRTAIHDYVTRPSLSESEATSTDVHGVYPVDPLGFPSTDTCGGDRECLGKGNPEFPQSANFYTEARRRLESMRGPESYIEVGANVNDMSGTTIRLPVESLAAINGEDHRYSVHVPGDLTEMFGTVGTVTFGNAGYDDYSITELFTNPATVEGTAEFDGTITSFTVHADPCRITGRVGSGRLELIIDAADQYLLLVGQDDSSENGMYLVTGTDEPWVKVASATWIKGEDVPENKDPYNQVSSLDNTPVCGHLRHGYSDREVAEYVETRMGDVISNAIHPKAVPGDLEGAGRLVKWFVECGDISIGDSNNDGKSIVVTGFGLGGHMTGECAYGTSCRTERRLKSDELPTEHPVINFSIGTKANSSNPDASYLPRDWPFTEHSPYNGDDIDNNITLVTEPVHLLNDNHSVGGLQHYIYGTCPKCGGSGEYEGAECPLCDGEGDVPVAKSDSNRIQLCVNNDFEPNTDGTTTFKKTYIHLPTNIDIQDGAEFEVTVSMPTVNVDDAYGTDDRKNISAYYDYVSTPRVIVMSGYWKFSDTSLSWMESESTANRTYTTKKIDVSGNDVIPFTDKEGNVLPVGTKVRFTLDGGLNCPRYADMKGSLMANEFGHVLITGIEGYPYTSRLRDRHMRICGVAYLDPNDDGLPTATNSLLGLHSRNSTTLELTTEGSGEIGQLDQYNRFIKPLMDKPGEETSRKGVCKNDARQVIAAVYPTATSTFPWTVVGRHKMRHLERLMTDEWDLGENSVSAMIWDSNKRLIDFNDTVGFFGYGNSCYGFPADAMPTRYAVNRFAGSSDKSVIGSQLRVKIKDGAYDETECNPVRQARKAVSMFADDFRKLRMFHGGKLPKISSASRIRTSAGAIDVSLDGNNGYFRTQWGTDVDGAPGAEAIANEIASAAWLSKARHLPEYVIVSGQNMSADNNSVIGANPFVDEPARSRYTAGFASAVYGNGYYETMTGHEVIPCDVRLSGNKNAFGYRSVISARVESDPGAAVNELYDDANRVAELQKVSIDRWSSRLGYDFTLPYDYLVDDNEYQKWMDIYSATSNVFSIDTIPTPDDCQVPVDLEREQWPMVSGDPMVTYNLESGETLAFTATNLPLYDESAPRSVALTNMLRRMVSPFGSRMPVRFWDGTRVAVATDGFKNNRVASLTRLAWFESACDVPGDVRGTVVDDEFIAKSAGTNTVDVNLNYVAMESTLHMNWSAPPAKVGRNWYNRPAFTGTDEFAGPSGYVRVFMKFKFSARSGRWYTVDYRQVPMSYLSPLYGAKALEETVDGVRIWSESMCAPNNGWKDILMHPYYKYAPMDINPEAIPGMVANAPDGADTENRTDLVSSTVHMPRFQRPYMPVADGGLGLNAPCDVNGNSADNAVLPTMPHANFWSVRKHLRPAVSVVDGSDIPAFAFGQDGERKRARSGGTMGDPVLWGQFDFPKKGIPEYVVPPFSFGDTGDKLVLSTGEYVCMDDGSIVEME